MTLSTPMRRTAAAPSEAGIRGPELGGLHLLAQDRPQDARTDQPADRRHQAGSIHRYRQTRTAQVPPAWGLVTADRRRAPPRLHRHRSRDHHSRSPISLLTSPRDPAQDPHVLAGPSPVRVSVRERRNAPPPWSVHPAGSYRGKGSARRSGSGRRSLSLVRRPAPVL